jgi:hypothetical protein
MSARRRDEHNARARSATPRSRATAAAPIMIDGLDALLDDTGHTGLPELRTTLQELWGGRHARGRLLAHQRLARGVYRLRFEVDGRPGTFVLKRLDTCIAHRNQLLVERWLPAVGLDGCGPTLLAVAAERNGRCVWHVYQDLDDCILDETAPDPQRVGLAVASIARLHTRFARHPLLAECRLWAGDRGISFYASSVRDAIRSVECLRPPAIELTDEHVIVRARLLERLHRLLDEEPHRARLLRELSGPETLLHGDLWPKNVIIVSHGQLMQARLIDWDRAAVGPISYDLSTFLSRFPRHERSWILNLYQQAIAPAGWQLPPSAELNTLLDTAEYARLANDVIWPAIAALDGADWALHQLACVQHWFDTMQPVLLPD